MQVFKAFYKILWQKKGSIILYTAIFLGLAIGLASVGQETMVSDFTAEKYDVAIFDYDKSEHSKEFIEYLSAKTTPVECEDDVEKLRDQLFVRNIAAVIYVKEGFSKELKSGNVENLIEVTTLPGSVYNQTILNYIEQYMVTLHGYLESDFSLETAMEKTAAIMNTEAEVTFSQKNVESGYSAMYYFMLYLPYVLTSCSILGVGNCIMVFNRKEVKDRMNISSYSLFKRNAGLWGGSVLTEIILLLFFLVVAAIMYGKKLFTFSGLFMVLNAFCYVVVALGITFLIGMVVKKATVLDMISNVVGLGFSFLGGLFVPLSIMGDGVKVVSRFIPTYWYATALEIVEKGKYYEKTGEFWMALGIQIAFAAAFTAVAMGISKMRQRES